MSVIIFKLTTQANICTVFWSLSFGWNKSSMSMFPSQMSLHLTQYICICIDTSSFQRKNFIFAIMEYTQFSRNVFKTLTAYIHTYGYVYVLCQKKIRPKLLPFYYGIWINLTWHLYITRVYMLFTHTVVYKHICWPSLLLLLWRSWPVWSTEYASEAKTLRQQQWTKKEKNKHAKDNRSEAI